MTDKQIKEKIEQLKQACREKGLKVTPQRIAVYSELVTSDQHPSAETLYEKVRRRFPNISLDTVNRTLQTLKDIGFAFVVEGTGGPRRFDAGMDTHQHLRCLKCRRIIDINFEPYNQICLPDNLEGFKVLRKSIYIEGLCRECNNDNSFKGEN